MTLHQSLLVLAATGCGIQLGTYLLLSLLYRPLFLPWPEDSSLLWVYKRLYRFNTVIAVISGVLAILGGAQSTGFLLAITGMSYLLLATHLLPAMANTAYQVETKSTVTGRRSPREILRILSRLQQAAHLLQILLLCYLIFSLMQ